ncbi:hypothetical protein [Oceanirhabdus sp. W0125-5]|uniref:hypothetical protein n=1 Tax=Oceanirhabdus sp. W0125-5 TaxID=2999116 RepID=UPI0022F3319E|nr:hypothetical protein [Oceanirhabdus sp. W0125-5]WBW97362.1 hypothetical protein OW730_00475 [Oceanirhabdus sp. W0125-5]
MKKKTIIIWALICLFASIVTIQYVNYKKNIEVTSSAPSQKWSKDKSVSEGFVKGNPSIIIFKEQIYIVHTTENGIRIVKTNMLGEVIDSKSYEYGKFMKDGIFTTDKRNLYISWISIKKGVRSFNHAVIDNDLNIKDIRVIEGILENKKLSDEEILISSGDTIKIVDNNLNILFESKKDNYENISAAKYKENTYIAYYNEEERAFNTIILENNKEVKKEKIATINKGIGVSFDNPILSVLGEELILTYEEFVKGEYMRTKGISYYLNTGKSQSKLVEIQGQPVRSIVRGDSQGVFFGYVERVLDKRFFEQDIVEFSIKDCKIVDYNYVSNSRKRAFHVANYKEYVVFSEFTKVNYYDLKLASSEELFKESINFISKEEKKEALNISLHGIAFSFAYMFIIGLTWMFFAFFIIGTISFISYDFSEKTSKVTYIVALLLVGIFQLYMIKNIMYTRYGALMPDPLSIGVGLTVTLIIYSLSAIFSYLIFNFDLETIPLIPFGGVLFIETFVILSVFVPYIT